jgi:hypothetical protein
MPEINWRLTGENWSGDGRPSPVPPKGVRLETCALASKADWSSGMTRALRYLGHAAVSGTLG